MATKLFGNASQNRYLMKKVQYKYGAILCGLIKIQEVQK